jgi:branched-chain amino acid transport system substrate-binding protein
MARRKNFYILGVILIVSALLFGACTAAPTGEEMVEEGAPEEEDSDVQVAFVGPLTGPGSQDLLLASRGADLAVTQRNEAGGVCGGRMVDLKLRDDKADPKEGATLATQLCNDESIIAAAHGWNSSVVLAAAPIFNECGLPQVDYFGVAPAIREAGPYTFRVIPTGELMAQYLADWVVNGEGYTKVASFYENTDYGKGLYDVFAASVEEEGGEVVASEAILMDQKDFSAIISKFKAAEAEVVVMFGQYEAAAFWSKQAPELGFDVPLYGSDGIFAPELINLAGEAVEGVRSVAAYSNESQDPYVQDFVESFREAYASDPNNGAGYAYDTLVLILNALDEGGCTREGVNEWLTTEVEDIQGVTGMISFDEKGDRKFQEDLYIKLEVKDGEFVEVSE